MSETHKYTSSWRSANVGQHNYVATLFDVGGHMHLHKERDSNIIMCHNSIKIESIDESNFLLLLCLLKIVCICTELYILC